MKTIKTFFLMSLMVTAMLAMADKTPVTISLNEEAYIDDIPFDTEQVAGSVMNMTDLSQFELEEEGYIDDIPFNTEAIAKEVMMRADYDRARVEVFPLNEESFIDDIPFSTESVVSALGQSDEAPQVASVKSTTIKPAVSAELPSMGILEILIPVIIILGTLSYAVYEYILS